MGTLLMVIQLATVCVSSKELEICPVIK
uniref:Uncharacterized protein n=1 Tax=Anguilla anguilla TaxID=7936 RepID=A0A0E9V2Z9_ANGAN